MVPAMRVPARSQATVDSARGWIVVAAAVVAMFVVFGLAYSFGAFFTSMANEFDASTSATALIFSLTISLSFILGLFTGRWVDRVGPRPVLLAGAASLSTGLLLTTVVPTLWLGYLTYGGGVGFAIACAYIPMVATVSSWFERHRATALGLAVTCIGFGTLVGSPTAAALIAATSWRVTFVIFAIVGGGLLVVVAFVAERGPAAQTAVAPRRIRELLRLRSFALLYTAIACITFGIFVPFVFIVRYAEQRGIEEVPAALLVGLIGGSSVVGRLGLGALADRLGSRPLFLLSFVVL
ncbi:MAG: MFS family permease, partial [Verrucomicrobiales bacterium]